VTTSPDRELDQYDYDPYDLLKGFRFPHTIEHNGTTYWYPTVLPGGRIQAIGEMGTEDAGHTFVFSAHQVEIDDRPLMELAREAFALHQRIDDCCHPAT
jgi:hypothetical protein